jgi:hypothetical protein
MSRDSANRTGINGFRRIPIFGRHRQQPEYQIEIHLGGAQALTPQELDATLGHVQTLLAPGVA